MPRISRAVAIGYPHHVTQRGNYQQFVFETDEDYMLYLQWLGEYSQRYSLKVWAYCLMGNHVHFVVVPMREDSLARTFNALHTRYSQYFNEKKDLRGHLWQGRFYSCILDERHLYAAIRYVENNPIRAGIVKDPCEYKWSSASRHVRGQFDPPLSNDCYLIKEIADWHAYLSQYCDDKVINNIRQNTKTGRLCGDEPFAQTIKDILGRELVALPRGRPPRSK